MRDHTHQTLVLAPTRELAMQIREELVKLSQGMRIFSVSCVGGISIRPQIKILKRRQHFVIGTPGRVIDLIERGNIKPQEFSAVVLDEADRMLDMGFVNDMRKILENTSPDRQTLFFSATMTKEAEALVHDFLKDPVTISVKKKDTANSIEQDVVVYPYRKKFMTLVDLLEDDEEFNRVIIFGAMKRTVHELADELRDHGITAVSLHGDKRHSERKKALQTFKEGDARVLVATDVAARGIHVNDVSHVINYDLPQVFEDYVHRIGRTGRGTKRGKALTFIPNEEPSYKPNRK